MLINQSLIQNLATRGHLAFDRSLARQCTWDRFRINEQTCQVDTLVWFSWYMAVIARWGMSALKFQRSFVNDAPTMESGRRAKSAKSFEQSRFTVILYTLSSALARSRETWFHDAVYFTTHHASTELSLINALIIDKIINSIYILFRFVKSWNTSLIVAG